MSTYTSRHTSFALARMAGCADPDRPDGSMITRVVEGEPNREVLWRHDGSASPGALFLRRVEDAARERWDTWTVKGESWPPEWADALWIHEVADGAVRDLGGGERWQVFVDLAAWQEDVTDYEASHTANAEHGGTLTYLATCALCVIAARLVRALVKSWAEGESGRY